MRTVTLKELDSGENLSSLPAAVRFIHLVLDRKYVNLVSLKPSKIAIIKRHQCSSMEFCSIVRDQSLYSLVISNGSTHFIVI